MSADSKIKLSDTCEHGVMLTCFDLELADQFEDFLTEDCFVFFNTKQGVQEVAFFFGQASSEQKVSALYERFQKSRNQILKATQ